MTIPTSDQIGFGLTLTTDFDSAITRVTEALKTEGFGVLTTIDVRATMRAKLDIDFSPYTILGACNPPLAHRALVAAPAVGLLLPCNVIVRAVDDGTRVEFVDPLMMMGVMQVPDLQPIAAEARTKLERVAKALAD